VFALTAAGATGSLVLNEGLDTVFALPNSGAIDITQTQRTSALCGSATTATLTSVTYSNTTCPDGTNSTNHASTCTGHLVP